MALPQPPPKPKRDYNAERQSAGRIGSGSARIGGRLSSFGRMAGRTGSLVFRELAKPGPKKTENGEAGDSKKYGFLKLRSNQAQVEDVLNQIESSNLSDEQKSVSKAQVIADSRTNATGKGVTQQKVAGEEKTLIRLVGKEEAAKITAGLEKAGAFKGGREHTGEDIQTFVKTFPKNTRPGTKDVAAILFGSLDQRGKPVKKRPVLSHENIAKTENLLREKYGEHAATKFARPFYPLGTEEKAGQPPPSRSEAWWGKMARRTAGDIGNIYKNMRGAKPKTFSERHVPKHTASTPEAKREGLSRNSSETGSAETKSKVQT